VRVSGFFIFDYRSTPMSNNATRTAASTPSNSAADSTADQSTSSYFDLHATGVGYLNRVRTVKVKGKGNDYLACDIAAMRGEKGDVHYTYFNCRVSGQEAQRVILEDLAEHIKAGKKIIVRFKAGDLIPDSFLRKNVKEGEDPRLHNIHAHLLFIYSAKVDGVPVYTAPRRDEATAQTAASPATTGTKPVQTQPQSSVERARAGMLESGMTEDEVDARLQEMDEIPF
jgi:hypothetical protein